LEIESDDSLGTAMGTMMDWVVDPQLEGLGGANGATMDAMAEGADGTTLNAVEGERATGSSPTNDTGVGRAETTMEAATSTSTSISAGGGGGLDANVNANDEMMNDTTMT